MQAYATALDGRADCLFANQDGMRTVRLRLPVEKLSVVKKPHFVAGIGHRNQPSHLVNNCK